MEKELLRESTWGTPEPFYSLNTAEDSTIQSIWEEDYQDLSDWCIDTFHNQCVFHIDESETMIHSGMKIGDLNSSTVLIGDIVDGGRIDDKSTIMMMEKKTPENESAENNKTEILSVDNKNEYFVGKLDDVPDSWLNLPQSSITAKRTDEWVQLIGNENKNSQQIIRNENENLHTANSRGKNLDIISTELNEFDLLSYVCNDNVQSTDSVSVESETVFQEETVVNKTKNPKITTRQRSRRTVKAENQLQSIISSITNPIAIENDEPCSSTASTTKSLRTIPTKKRKIPQVTTRAKKEKIEIDFDDDSSNYSYRESREKNNEASRKSRMNKKTKERELMSKADDLERDNRLLKIRVEQLDKMVTSMRAAILQSALNKSN